MLVDDIAYHPVVCWRLDAEAATVADAAEPDEKARQLIHCQWQRYEYFSNKRIKSGENLAVSFFFRNFAAKTVKTST